MGQLILNTHDLFTKSVSSLSADEGDYKEAELIELEKPNDSLIEGSGGKNEFNISLTCSEIFADLPNHDPKVNEQNRNEISLDELDGKDEPKNFQSKTEESRMGEKNLVKVTTEDTVDDTRMSKDFPILLVNGVAADQSSPSTKPFEARVSASSCGQSRPPLASSEDDVASTTNSSLSDPSTTSDNSDVFPNDRRRYHDDDEHLYHRDEDDSRHERKLGNQEKDILCQEDQPKGKGRISRNFNAVKSLGMDLVVEMKERKKEMKNWTEKKVPGLRR